MYVPWVSMTNRALYFKKHCRIPFGSYCQVFQQNNPTNTPEERTLGAICLGPTGNSQGSYKYFAFAMKMRITRPQATPVPITEDIVKWVEKIGIAQKIPEVLKFTIMQEKLWKLVMNTRSHITRGQRRKSFCITTGVCW